MTREEFGNAYERDFQQTVRQLVARGTECEQARDLAQAAWARGWERISQLQNQELVVVWVNMIARNLLVNNVRRSRRLDFSEVNAESATVSTINLAALDMMNALQKCKPNQRRLLEAFLAGYSNHELAIQSGKSLGAIHAEMCRARRALRELMQVTRRQVLPGESVSQMSIETEDNALDNGIRRIALHGGRSDQADLMKKGLA
jgi:RNA polymerase sigma factor (sigma-70 family)